MQRGNLEAGMDKDFPAQRNCSEPVLSRSNLAQDVFFHLGVGNGVVTSFGLAACTGAFALFGYDWGREVLEELLKESVHWNGATTVLGAAASFFLIVQTSYGFYSGMLVDRQRKVPVVLGGFFALLIATSALRTSMGGVLALQLAAIGSALCVLGYCAGAAMREEMPRMPLLAKALMPALWYLLPAGIFLLLNPDGNFGFREEVAIFSLSVFVATRIAAQRCEVRGIEAGLCTALLTSLPLVAITVMNLAVNVLAIGLGVASTNAWQALTSTLIVTTCLAVSAAAGGVYGAYRNQSPRRITVR